MSGNLVSNSVWQVSFDREGGDGGNLCCQTRDGPSGGRSERCAGGAPPEICSKHSRIADLAAAIQRDHRRKGGNATVVRRRRATARGTLALQRARREPRVAMLLRLLLLALLAAAACGHGHQSVHQHAPPADDPDRRPIVYISKLYGPSPELQPAATPRKREVFHRRHWRRPVPAVTTCDKFVVVGPYLQLTGLGIGTRQVTGAQVYAWRNGAQLWMNVTGWPYAAPRCGADESWTCYFQQPSARYGCTLDDGTRQLHLHLPRPPVH